MINFKNTYVKSVLQCWCIKHIKLFFKYDSNTNQILIVTVHNLHCIFPK